MHKSHIDLKSAHILLVDDTPANLDVLCALLETEGYQISLAPNGKVALKIAPQAEAAPDLILLDVMMPGMDGFEVCRRLKADPKTREIPVIFITAEDQTESLVKGFQAGGVDYIPKPFRDQEVRVRVRNALLTKFLFDQNRAYQEKMEKELQTAHELQMGLMPKAPPALEGFEIAGRCLPAEQVGGDFFQYFARPQGGLAIALADVTGHAMAAAIPVVLFNGMLEVQMERGGTLEELFARLNRSVHRLLDSHTLVCFALARLDPASRCLHLSNAGLPYPVHYRAADGEVEELQTEQAYPLGASAEAAHRSLEVKLAPGDRVVFCSDGMVEAENAQREMFGFERLGEVVRKGCMEGLDAAALLERLMGAVRCFAGDAPQADDQTVVVLEVGR
ncbi:MAG: SpoIIE family protein phosphatase [Candidatus Latescibacteria bacterium]|nr:SpoIIE family protein phosphatase [Candidatus Latescibacterota bacterium]